MHDCPIEANILGIRKQRICDVNKFAPLLKKKTDDILE